jgi:hypothetical protein
MCVDYTDLNKHYPKDPFGLPRIDQVIDYTAGCDLLCFLDCYSGYHQIAIKEEDQEKNAFITSFGAYCYTTMSFGLKNASATYQRAIQDCFKRLVLGVMREQRDRCLVHLSRTPTGQRTSRARQWDGTRRSQEATNTKGGKWIKELPNVLWGLRTQPTKPTG